MAEDFPQVDCHSLNKEADKKFTNIHQLVFLFCNPKSPSYTIFKALPIARFEEGDLVPFSTYNNIRYTFIKNLFKSYDLYDQDFKMHLKKLQSAYVWNIYRQLTEQFLHKTAGMQHKQIEAFFKPKVLEPLQKVIRTKIHISAQSAQHNQNQNTPQKDYLKLKLVIPDTDQNLINKADFKHLENYIQQMNSDKQYTAPLRILFAGNDSQFNDFVHVYVSKVLQMKPILLRD